MEKISIFIVEDEAIVAMDLEIRLTRMGFRVVGKAASGKNALELFENQPIDLVLMDINLKGDLDGVQTAEKMAILNPTPIIYLTAQTDSLTFDRAKNTRPAAYLTKPFDEKNLQLAIELAIHNFAIQKVVDRPLLMRSPLDLAESTSNTKLKTQNLPNADNILKTDNAIFIKQNYRFVKFQPEDLLFVQADGMYSDLVTCDHKYTLRLTLTQVLERLHMPKLIRTHRSFAVNLKNINEFNDSEVTIGKHSIPIGASYKENFLSQFDFM